MGKKPIAPNLGSDSEIPGYEGAETTRRQAELQRVLGALRVVVVAFVLIQLFANLQQSMDFLSKVNISKFPLPWELPWSEFSRWHLKANIDSADASVIVTALVILVATFNIAFITLSLSTPEDAPARIRLHGWFDNSQNVVLVAEGVAVAFGITQFEEKPGLAVGLVLVGLLCFRVSDLAIEGAESNLGARPSTDRGHAVRAAAVESNSRAQSELQRILPKSWRRVQSGLRPSRHYKFRIGSLVVATLALQGIVQSTIFPMLTGQSEAIVEFFRSAIFFTFYDALTTGPMLLAIMWTGSILIGCAQGKWFAPIFKIAQACLLVIWIVMLFSIYNGDFRYLIPISALVTSLAVLATVHFALKTGRGIGLAVPRLAAAFLAEETTKAEAALRRLQKPGAPHHR